MLDLKKASAKIDELINQITKEGFESWLIKDKDREEQAFLCGHPLKFQPEHSIILSPKIIKETAELAVSSFITIFFIYVC